MAGFVLDASIALAASLPGESGIDIAPTVLKRIPVEEAVVPELWHMEVGNAVLYRLRRGLLNSEEAAPILLWLRTLPVVVDNETSRLALDVTFHLALAHTLTLYDACYLELALRKGLPLATFDKALRRAAEAERVVLANPPA